MWHFFALTFVPGAPQEIVASLDELQRIATSPEAALRLWEMNSAVDASKLAKWVHTLTLVLHCRPRCSRLRSFPQRDAAYQVAVCADLLPGLAVRRAPPPA
jgi:hypothetical protein